MKIAVISDTHLHAPGEWLEAVYDSFLATADILVHCGDTTGFPVWSFFNQHPNFYAVRGNMDEWRLAEELPDRESFRAGGLNFGAMHGFGFSGGVEAGVARSFGREYDVVFYGHTHKPLWTEMGGVKLLNPGSLKAGMFQPGTLAYLHVDQEGRLEPEFLDVPDSL